MSEDKNIRQLIVKMSKQAFEQKLFAGTSGNLSVYEREKDRLYITPSGVRYETMLEEDVMVIRLDGTVLEGKHLPSSEWRLHAQVYKNDASIGAIVHTHSPFATAFAVNRQPIPATLTEMFPFLGGQVECAAYAKPGTDEVGINALPVLSGKGGCLLANHGVLAIGRDMAQAYIRAEYIEDTARVYTIAKAIGEPVILSGL